MDALAATDICLFEGFRLDRRGGALSQRNGHGVYMPIAIGSRALNILGVLVERPGELFSRTEIIDAVWPGTAVEDSNLNVQVAALSSPAVSFCSVKYGLIPRSSFSRKIVGAYRFRSRAIAPRWPGRVLAGFFARLGTFDRRPVDRCDAHAWIVAGGGSRCDAKALSLLDESGRELQDRRKQTETAAPPTA